MNWSFTLAAFVLQALLLARISFALQFPSYTYQDHPLLRDNKHEFIEPVVMRSYLRFNGKHGWTTNRMLFTPGTASYNHFNGDHFASSIDSLFVIGSVKRSRSPYLKVVLNKNARVFVLLNVDGLELKNVTTDTKVSGVSTNWKLLGAVRTPTGESIQIGDSQRLGGNVTLPSQGVVLQTFAEAGKPFVLPHPRSVRVGGYESQRFTVLFAKPEADKVIRFEYPQVPSTVFHKARGKPVETSAVLPNARCPVWLHDTHLTASTDVEAAKKKGEKVYWRTWHPMIDPVWWCYYDHDHGTYPGQYRPKFHYTAYNTPDTTTKHGRQEESHNGFKVFSFALEHQKKFVVITVHMQLSMARRFTVRHHTITFAVLNANWEMEAELSMKADFGAAVVTLKDRSELPISARDAGIIRELDGKRRFARRRFNILNVDAEYPASVNSSFLYHNHLVPTSENKNSITEGIYEQWRASLTTCMRPKTRYVNRGFNFDVRNPSTALRRLNATSDLSMQKLAGDNVNRFLKLRDTFLFGRELCQFDNVDGGKEPSGVFYTDPYFARVQAAGAGFSVRQFISPTLGTVELKSGLLLPTGPWSEPLTYVPKGTKRVDGRRLENIENAVRKSVN